MQPFKDEDDIDLFISPSRFSGRTPSAKSTRGRIFGDPPGGQPAGAGGLPPAGGRAGASGGRPPNPRRNQMPQERAAAAGGMGHPSMSKGIAEQSRIRSMVSSANLLAALVGLLLMGVAGWLAAKQENPGVRALFAAELQLLQSPLYFGAVLFIAGLSMVLFGAVIGAGALSEGLASGYILHEQRKLFMCYSALVFLALIGLCASAIAAMAPIMAFQGKGGIDMGVWSTLSPALLCQYEARAGCGGLEVGSCTLVAPLTAGQKSTCPGLYCSDLCGQRASAPPGQECSRCKEVLNVEACRDHEIRTNRLKGCGESLLREVRFLWYLALASSGAGIATVLGVTIVDVLAAST